MMLLTLSIFGCIYLCSAGVPGLWKEVPNITLMGDAELQTTLENTVLIVDLSSWICTLKGVNANVTQMIFYRIVKLVSLGVSFMVGVFDAFAIPENKKRKKATRFDKATLEVIDQIFKGFNFYTVQSKSEAEIMCAAAYHQFSREGFRCYIISEDSDMLVFGGKVIRKLQCFASSAECAGEVVDAASMDFSNIQWAFIASVCGCDFTGGLPGIGVKKAFALAEHIKDRQQAVKFITERQGSGEALCALDFFLIQESFDTRMPIFLSIDVDVLRQAVPLPNFFQKLQIAVVDQWLRGLSTCQLTLHYPWLGPPTKVHFKNDERNARLVFAANGSIKARGSILKWYWNHPLSTHRIVEIGHAHKGVLDFKEKRIRIGFQRRVRSGGIVLTSRNWTKLRDVNIPSKLWEENILDDGIFLADIGTGATPRSEAKRLCKMVLFKGKHLLHIRDYFGEAKIPSRHGQTLRQTDWERLVGLRDTIDGLLQR